LEVKVEVESYPRVVMALSWKFHPVVKGKFSDFLPAGGGSPHPEMHL